MREELSADALRAIFAQETDEVFVMACQIDHPEWVEPVRLVSDTKDLVYLGNTFRSYPFTANLPEQKEGSLPSVRLSVDNVTRDYIEGVRNVATPLHGEVYVFRRSIGDVDTMELEPLRLKANKVTYNVSSLSLILSLDADYLNEPATKDRFLPSNSPGLFA